MKEGLKRNICNLDNCAAIRDISTQKKDHIGAALEYACQYWTKHLVNVPSKGHNVEEVHKAVDEFFTKHLLFWIEVLVMMGVLDAGVYAINDIRQWYTSVSCA